MLEIDEVSENLHFGRPRDFILDLIFGPLDVILGAFLRPGRPPGTLFGTLAVQGAKMDVFGVPSGHLLGSILDTFWAPSRKGSFKNMKKSVSGSDPQQKAEKQHFTNRVWRGPERHPIDACRTFREVRCDALGVILGGLLGHFWSYFEYFWGSGPQLGLPKQVPKGDLEIRGFWVGFRGPRTAASHAGSRENGGGQPL